MSAHVCVMDSPLVCVCVCSEGTGSPGCPTSMPACRVVLLRPRPDVRMMLVSLISQRDMLTLTGQLWTLLLTLQLKHAAVVGIPPWPLSSSSSSSSSPCSSCSSCSWLYVSGQAEAAMWDAFVPGVRFSCPVFTSSVLGPRYLGLPSAELHLTGLPCGEPQIHAGEV